jgi:hypothetical protein
MLPTEAGAGRAGRKIKSDQPRIVRAEKDPIGAGRLGSDCCIVPDRDAAADGVVGRVQIGRQDWIEHPEFVPGGVQGDDAVEWRAEDELAGAARIGVTYKELRVKAAPCRAASAVR